MEFNPAKSNTMLLDINSCFATIEQQANPLLRNQPVVVAAFTTDKGCILASSVDAKRLGIKTGMRIMEARAIFPKVIVLAPDPPKYRDVHNKLHNLLKEYSIYVEPKSIDEFIFEPITNNLLQTAKEIKQRIREEIGDYITVSIGIAPNKYLAKVAAGLVKPDGLVEINKDNFLEIYKNMKLKDLTGIKNGNEARLNSLGIYTVMDFYNYNKPSLGNYWNLRLRGYEVDDLISKRMSFSNEVSLKISKTTNVDSIVARLLDKANFRARTSGFKAKKKEIFVSHHKISVKLSNLTDSSFLQLDLFGQEIKRDKLEKTVDSINKKLGNFVIGSAKGFMAKDKIKDRISFGQL